MTIIEARYIAAGRPAWWDWYPWRKYYKYERRKAEITLEWLRRKFDGFYEFRLVTDD